MIVMAQVLTATFFTATLVDIMCLREIANIPEFSNVLRMVQVGVRCCALDFNAEPDSTV